MRRSCYSDDFGDDNTWQLPFFRANVDRSLRGRKGQARLRELRDALLVLPVKALEAETFADGTSTAPKVCALGAWALAKRGGDPAAAFALVGRSDADDHDTAQVLEPHGWPRLVVLETIYINDDGNYWRPETPEQRYTRVLAWVESNLTESRGDGA